MLWMLLVAACAPPPPGVADAQPVDLSSTFNCAETEFDAGILPLDMPPKGSWTRSDLQQAKHFRWTWADHRLCSLELRTRDSGASSRPEEFEWMRCLWTGSEWYSVCDEERSYVIDRAPRFNTMTDFLAAFNGVDWSIMSAPGGLRKAVAGSKLLSQEHDGNVERIRVSRNDRDSLQLEIAYDTGVRRLTEIVVEMFNDEAGPETMVLVGRVRFEVVEWMTIDGRNLPQRAIRESTRFVSERLGATPDKPFLQRVGFIRRSFRAMTPDQVDGRVFLPPVGKPRMGVADMRQRISYSIGDNVVLVDGSLFELATPIDHIVQPEELPGLLKSAKAKD